MLKKLFVTAAAAAAVSVPLAGVASADPSSNNPPGQGATGHGVPHELGAYADSVGASVGVPLNPNGPGNPIPPGQEINIGKDTYAQQHPGVKASTPVAVGEFVNGIYALQGVSTDFGPTAPGLAVKSFTPGCSSGHVAVDGNNNVAGADLCH